MNKEELVIYKEKRYFLVHEYSSGYCEIREVDTKFNYELVHNTEIIKTAPKAVHKVDAIVWTTESAENNDCSNKSTMLLLLPKNKKGLRSKPTIADK